MKVAASSPCHGSLFIFRPSPRGVFKGAAVFVASGSLWKVLKLRCWTMLQVVVSSSFFVWNLKVKSETKGQQHKVMKVGDFGSCCVCCVPCPVLKRLELYILEVVPYLSAETWEKKSPKCFLRYFKSVYEIKPITSQKPASRMLPPHPSVPASMAQFNTITTSCFTSPMSAMSPRSWSTRGPLKRSGPWRKTKPTLAGRNFWRTVENCWIAKASKKKNIKKPVLFFIFRRILCC